VRPLAVVEPDPVIDDPLGLETVIDFVQIDCLLLQGSPEPLAEDVVQIATAPIHRDFDIGLGQSRDPPCAPKFDSKSRKVASCDFSSPYFSMSYSQLRQLIR
jgi:hypothetical protein